MMLRNLRARAWSPFAEHETGVASGGLALGRCAGATSPSLCVVDIEALEHRLLALLYGRARTAMP